MPFSVELIPVLQLRAFVQDLGCVVPSHSMQIARSGVVAFLTWWRIASLVPASDAQCDFAKFVGHRKRTRARKSQSRNRVKNNIKNKVKT